MDAIARTFKPLWHVDNGFTVTNEGAHMVLCSVLTVARMWIVSYLGNLGVLTNHW